MASTVTDRIDGLTTSVAVKAPCATATTTSIGLSGLQTVGGVVLADGDRVLVKNQSDSTQNGIYVARTTAWERARDFDGSRDVVNGTLAVVVASGNEILYRAVASADPIIIGSSSITFIPAAFGDASSVSFVQSGTGAVTRNAQTKMREIFSVTDFGAVGDGVTNDTAAFLAAIAALDAHNGGTLFVPRGKYIVTSTLDFSALEQFNLIGEGSLLGGSTRGTRIDGNIAGDLVKFVVPGGGVQQSFTIRDIYFNNTSLSASATTIHVENILSGSIENCAIFTQGGFGIYAKDNTFTLKILRCRVTGDYTTNPSCVGIYSGGHTDIDTCDITACGEGVRAGNASVNIHGCRVEVNIIGFNLGVKYDGTTLALSRSSIIGNSFEANDTGVILNSANNCVIAGIGMQGSAGSPSAQSKIGVKISSASYCSFSGWSINGTFNDAAMRIEGGNGAGFTMADVSASNSYTGAKTWDVKCALGTAGSYKFVNCNYTARPDDTIVSGNFQRHGQCQYMGMVDYINANVEGKNLRGKLVALGNGVATKAVAFTAAKTAGAAQINTAVATNTGGATLAAGTYYYLATAVTARGECSGTAEKTVVIGGANNSTTVSFFGMTADGFKRRIYRGRTSGIYDGYFEHTLNANTNFVDIGQAFNGYKSPPTAGIDETSMIEPDANYGVLVTPSWLTTCRVTAKSTSGFTVDFGTATPDANQTFDYLIVR